MTKSTIQRCPKDYENPYAQISRDLIRDERLSPNCRWLLIYLLSMKDGWVIKPQQIWNHAKAFIGRDKVYSLLNEAIEAGYMRREDHYENNLRTHCIYFLSEWPKFKKICRSPENGECESEKNEPGQNPPTSSFERVPENKECENSPRENSKNPSTDSCGRLPENQAVKKEHISSKEEIEKKKRNIKEKAKPSPQAQEISFLLLKKILEVNPTFSENTQTWQKQCEALLKKKPFEFLKTLIEWIFTNDFWDTIIVSPTSLKRNMAKIEPQYHNRDKCFGSKKQSRAISSEYSVIPPECYV